MKRLHGAIVFLALLGITMNVKAAQCRVNGGPWIQIDIGGTLNLQVPVDVRLGSDATRILLEGRTWNADSRLTPVSRLISRTTGQPVYKPVPLDAWAKVRQPGYGPTDKQDIQNTPVPYGIRVSTMPNNSLGVPINVTPYILIRNNPTNPIDIRIGDTLGVLRLYQTNNYNAYGTALALTYTAANNFSISPSTCTINNNNPIEINFGDVNQRAIGSDPSRAPSASTAGSPIPARMAALPRPSPLPTKGYRRRSIIGS